MTCFACHRDAVAECPRCARAFCAQHGASVCAVCASPASVYPSGALFRVTAAASAALVALAGAYLLAWPDIAPMPARPVLAGLPGGVRPSADAAAPAPGLQNMTAPAPAATPTAAPLQRKYTVAAGDTLLSIALRYNTTVEALARLNALTDTARLSIGQELVLDPAPPAGSAAGGSQPSAAVAAPAPRTYTVMAGDTLIEIARRNGTTVDELMRLNGLTNAGYLRIGQELVLAPAPAIGTAAPAPTATPAPRKYTVVNGDTLGSIAARTGTTVAELMRVNGLTDPHRLSVGQELVLP